MDIAYAREKRLDPAEFVDVLQRSGLSERRPVDDSPRIARMAANSNLIVTARKDGLLIGLARSLTDFGFCCYLSDLAVDRAYQRGGIGRALVERTRQEAGYEATLILLSAPAAMDYYPRLGMELSERAYVFARRG